MTDYVKTTALTSYAKKTDLPTLPNMTLYAKKTDLPTLPKTELKTLSQMLAALQTQLDEFKSQSQTKDMEHEERLDKQDNLSESVASLNTGFSQPLMNSKKRLKKNA